MNQTEKPSKEEMLKASDLQKLAECYQPLFDLMHDEFNLTLLHQDMDEIMIASHAVEQNLRGLYAEQDADESSPAPAKESETEEAYSAHQIRCAGVSGELNSIDIEHLINVLNSDFKRYATHKPLVLPSEGNILEEANKQLPYREVWEKEVTYSNADLQSAFRFGAKWMESEIRRLNGINKI